jgi:DNA end-binding protein Ku
MPRKLSKTRQSSEPNASVAKRSKQFWSGTISFGLVSIPVDLLPAHRRGRVSLREVDRDGTPLKRRFICPREDRMVPLDQTVRGFVVQEGEYVIVTDKELEDLEPQKSREIDLQRFVARSEISPLYFEKSYYLVPTGDSTKAYRLLAEVLETTERVGIATFVMRDRGYVIAISGEAGILRGETLRYVDEIRKPDDIGLAPQPEIDAQLLNQFRRAIKALEKDRMDSREIENEYTGRLEALIEKKRKRGVGVVEISQEQSETDWDDDGAGDGEDLLETIRRSLGIRNGKSGRNGRSSSAKSDKREADRHTAKPASHSKPKSKSKSSRPSRSATARGHASAGGKANPRRK